MLLASETTASMTICVNNTCDNDFGIIVNIPAISRAFTAFVVAWALNWRKKREMSVAKGEVVKHRRSSATIKRVKFGIRRTWCLVQFS